MEANGRFGFGKKHIELESEFLQVEVAVDLHDLHLVQRVEGRVEARADHRVGNHHKKSDPQMVVLLVVVVSLIVDICDIVILQGLFGYQLVVVLEVVGNQLFDLVEIVGGLPQ